MPDKGSDVVAEKLSARIRELPSREIAHCARPSRARSGEHWLVVLDVDGTILHEDQTLSDATIEAMRAVRDAGHDLTIATGRSWETTLPVLQVIDVCPDYVVCANGAVTMRRDMESPDGFSRAVVETFDPRPVLQRIKSGLPDGRFMVEDAGGQRFYTEGMAEWDLRNAIKVEFDALAEVPVTRVVCVSPSHSLEEFLSVVGEMGLHQVSYSIGYTAWLDIAPEGVNKATALERVREWQGVPLERVFAAGDGRNDIEMLQWAARGGRAVVMGQAPDEVIAAGNELTLSVDEDGLAAALADLR